MEVLELIIVLIVLEKVFSFKGDNVHGFDPSERVPDPKRMTEGYFRSSATM